MGTKWAWHISSAAKRVIAQSRRPPGLLPRNVHVTSDTTLARLSCTFIDRVTISNKSLRMARGIEGNEMSTPKPKPKLVSSQSSGNQKSILGFFKKAGPSPASAAAATAKSVTSKGVAPDTVERAIPTPTSSIEATLPSSPTPIDQNIKAGGNKENGLPSPVTSELNEDADGAAKEGPSEQYSSPSRRVSSLCSEMIWAFLMMLRARKRSATPSQTMKTTSL